MPHVQRVELSISHRKFHRPFTTVHAMVEQKEINLNVPIPADTATTIRRVPLDPSMATVALTLHGDYYRQLQSKTNHRLLWHPLVQLYIWGVFFGSTVYIFWDLYAISDSAAEFAALFWRNKFILTSFFPPLIFVAATVGLAGFTLSDDFRVITDNLSTEAYLAQVFRFPLRVYANARPEDMQSGFVTSASQSTDFIEYRGSPIAVVTVIPLPEKSNKDTFYCKITGLHVRKAYRKAGLENELLAYAKEKARMLCDRYVHDNNLKTTNLRIVIVAESYSVDAQLTRLYEQNNFFVKNSSYHLNPFAKGTGSRSEALTALCMKILGIFRVTYELQIDNTIDLTTGSSSVKQKAKQRRR